MSTKCLSLTILLTLFSILSSAQENDRTPNDFDENGRTPLINAVLNNSAEDVTMLLVSGVNPNTAELKNLKGSPLMYASSMGNTDIVDQLIKYKATIDQLDTNGDHALNWATFSGQVTVMNRLLDAKSDVFIKSKHGTALDVAFRLWHHDSVAEVFKRTKLANQISKDDLDFVDVILSNNSTTTLKLLKKGASPDVKDQLGTPVLHLAAQKGYDVIVNLLIDHGANVNALNSVGQTALAWAARFGHLSTVDLLIRSGADVNKAGEAYNLTPLIGASVNGNTSITALLVENGASIDIKDVVNQSTALHWALWYGHTDIAKFLIHHNADYTYKALDNRYSAYDMAKLSKLEDVVVLIESMSQKNQHLTGSWKLQEIQYIYSDTTYVVNEGDFGRFIFYDDHYALMYHPTMQARKPFKILSKPETDETVYGFRSIVFNTGTFKVNDAVVATTADMAKVPGFEGGQQFYEMTLNDDHLELVMFDETYPDGQKPEWFGKLKIKFLLQKE